MFEAHSGRYRFIGAKSVIFALTKFCKEEKMLAMVCSFIPVNIGHFEEAICLRQIGEVQLQLKFWMILKMRYRTEQMQLLDWERLLPSDLGSWALVAIFEVSHRGPI